MQRRSRVPEKRGELADLGRCDRRFRLQIDLKPGNAGVRICHGQKLGSRRVGVREQKSCALDRIVFSEPDLRPDAHLDELRDRVLAAG